MMNQDSREELLLDETFDKGHGCMERRQYYLSCDMDWFEDKKLWRGLRSVGMIISTRECHGTVSRECRYFLTSIKDDVKQFAEGARGHWGVENNLHWSLDVIFNEDNSRARSGYAAENLAALRRLALNLLKKNSTKKLPIRRKRLVAAWNNDYLGDIIGI